MWVKKIIVAEVINKECIGQGVVIGSQLLSVNNLWWEGMHPRALHAAARRAPLPLKISFKCRPLRWKLIRQGIQNAKTLLLQKGEDDDKMMRFWTFLKGRPDLTDAEIAEVKFITIENPWSNVNAGFSVGRTASTSRRPQYIFRVGAPVLRSGRASATIRVDKLGKSTGNMDRGRDNNGNLHTMGLNRGRCHIVLRDANGDRVCSYDFPDAAGRSNSNLAPLTDGSEVKVSLNDGELTFSNRGQEHRTTLPEGGPISLHVQMKGEGAKVTLL